MDDDQTARVRALNDELRQWHMGGRLMYSSGVVALGHFRITDVLGAIARFDSWNAVNDPLEEHDSGIVVAAGERVFWKIDCLTKDLASFAIDPSDPEACVRIMTVMLASEH